MTARTSLRYLSAAIVVGLLSAIPAGGSSSPPVASEPTGLFIEGCFLLPVEPGQLQSKQWCTKAVAGTPLKEILRGAPEEFEVFESDSHITLGTDYDGPNSGGATFQWWAHDTCATGRNYVGNYPSEWNDRVSSAQLGPSSNGCNWFQHYENADQGGTEFYCGRTSHDCSGQRIWDWFNDRSSSVRFKASL